MEKKRKSIQYSKESVALTGLTEDEKEGLVCMWTEEMGEETAKYINWFFNIEPSGGLYFIMKDSAMVQVRPFFLKCPKMEAHIGNYIVSMKKYTELHDMRR